MRWRAYTASIVGITNTYSILRENLEGGLCVGHTGVDGRVLLGCVHLPDLTEASDFVNTAMTNSASVEASS
jgi:hypothetical protein